MLAGAESDRVAVDHMVDTVDRWRQPRSASRGNDRGPSRAQTLLPRAGAPDSAKGPGRRAPRARRRTEQTSPLGLIDEDVRESPARVRLAQEQVDRLGIADVDEGVRAHGLERIAVRQPWLHRSAARSYRFGSVEARSSHKARASASGSPPISRAAVSALRRLPAAIARWNLPCAVPWLVIVGWPLGRRLLRTWLQRFMDERLPPLAEVALAASALAELRHGRRAVGVEALKRIVRR
jgi:hypothetical protein